MTRKQDERREFTVYCHKYFSIIRSISSSRFLIHASSCCLVTFYFTFKYLRSDNSQLSQEDEKSALVLIDTYGSYLDIHKALVLAGKLQSRPIIDKLLSVAKFDPQHGEALKGLQRAKTLLFYEPVSTRIIF